MALVKGKSHVRYRSDDHKDRLLLDTDFPSAIATLAYVRARTKSDEQT